MFQKKDKNTTGEKKNVIGAVVKYITVALVAAVLEDPCCAANPLTVESYLVRSVLEEAAGRG